MKSFITFLNLVGISVGSAAILVVEGELPPQVIPEPRQFAIVPSGVAEPRQFAAVPPVVPEPRQSGCQLSFDFTHVGQRVLLLSSNYPNTYFANANCKYSVKSPAGTKITMNCNDFNVEHGATCQYDKFSVSLTGDPNLMDASTMCGKGKFERTSTSTALTVGFTSDARNAASTTPYRFNCTLTAVSSPSAPVHDPDSPAPTAAPTSTRAPVVPSTSDDTCSCGFRNEAPRIVGGGLASAHEFPWRCHLYSPNLSGPFCGATVISNRWILTAAHCTAVVIMYNLQGSLYVNCGDHDLTTNSEAVNQLVKVSRIVDHPSYNAKTFDNDLSLLELEAPLTLSRTVQPVCLPWNLVGKSVQGTTVVASGWGTTSSGGNGSMILKKVDLPVLTTEECQRYYGTAITNNMICTYNPGEDTCQGDSGGSIDYKDSNTGRYYSVGVVSWGVGCAEPIHPGVYAYVNNYLPWIQSQTSETFCKA